MNFTPVDKTTEDTLEAPSPPPVPPATTESRLTAAIGAVKAARKGIAASVALFTAGVATGLIRPELYSPILEVFNETLVSEFGERDLIGRIVFLFVHNVTATFTLTLLGVVVCLAPAVMAFFNGAIIGAVSSAVIGAGKGSLLIYLLPHGVFELPAFFIATGLGIWYGTWFFRKDLSETFLLRTKRVMLGYLFTVPLLFIAAIIEGLVSVIGAVK